MYNEQENLSPLAQEIRLALHDIPHLWEVIFVDDGSTDNSLAMLRTLAAQDARIRYAVLDRNYGQSAAFAAGFQEAKGSILVTLDADLQNDPADIPLMLHLYGQGYDMVAGWRGERQDGPGKKLASKIANAIRNGLSGESIRDTGCSLKVFRASLARRMPVFRGMHRFFPTLMRMQGARITEVKVRHRARLHGRSKYGIWDRAFGAFYDLLAIRWMLSRHCPYTIKERS